MLYVLSKKMYQELRMAVGNDEKIMAYLTTTSSIIHPVTALKVV